MNAATSSSSPSVIDAFAGDLFDRLVPLAGFAKLHGEQFRKLRNVTRLAHLVWDFLSLKCGGWKNPESIPFVRTEDLAAIFDVTPRRALLAIGELVEQGLVRRLTPGQRSRRGCRYAIVQPGEHKGKSDPPASVIASEDGSPRITFAAKSDPPASIVGRDTSNGLDRSPQITRARARGAGGEKVDCPERAEAVHVVTACPDEQWRVRSATWATGVFLRLENTLLSKCDARGEPLSLGLLVVAAQQYVTRTGAWAPAPDAPANLELGIAVICDDVVGWAAETERRAKRVDKPRPAPADDTVQVPMLKIPMSAVAAVARAEAYLAKLSQADEPKIDSSHRLAAGMGNSERGQR